MFDVIGKAAQAHKLKLDPLPMKPHPPPKEQICREAFNTPLCVMRPPPYSSFEMVEVVN